MADVLTFDPASEFEIIESLDFEEEIQRPEELRFFTLDEQLLDYFDKVLPKKKTITKFEYAQIAHDVDRIRELYTKTITVGETYTVDLSRKEVSIPWVKYLYSDYEYKSYSFTEQWNPLYDRENRTVPNYYPRMLSAIPKPYSPTGSGISLMETATLTNEDGDTEIKSLGTYMRSKSILHEDGSMSVIRLPVENTRDDMKVRGYYIGNRGVDIPQPLAGHPFLSSTKSSPLLTDQPLVEVFPSVEAILHHGVPVTTDPYTEGNTYLKVYDVALDRIPWNLWRDRFPPADTITAQPKVDSIKFPDTRDVVQPSKSLQDTYVLPWLSGLDPRVWLMSQEDRGQLVVKMVQSKASEAGLLPPDNKAEKPQPKFTESTAEDCLDVTSFNTLLTSGLYRSKEKVCVPLSHIVHERTDLLSMNKEAWKEGTEFEMLKDYQKLLQQFQYSSIPAKAPVYEKIHGSKESELRRDIKAILNDEHRAKSDKGSAIRTLVQELSLTNEQYLDTSNLFVVCGHTIAELEGEMASDRLGYYARWTAIDEGFRSCKFCGEQINADVLVAQDDFDENGKVVKSYDVMDVGPAFHGESHASSFTDSLKDLKKLFLLEFAGESTLYLLISLLQVLPTESQLLPIVQNIRGITAVLKANKKIPPEDKNRIEGVLGIAGAVILLQTHNPFLIPRRSFGSKVLKLTGYPRDTTDGNDSPVLDTIITILKTTIEESPNTFKGPSTTLFRTLIKKPKDVRKETLTYLKQAATKFKVELETAKERYDTTPQLEEVVQVYLPLIPVPKNSFAPFERMGTEEQTGECSIYTPKRMISGKLLPNVRQEPVVLWKDIKITDRADIIQVVPDVAELVHMSTENIRKGVALGFPKGLKLEKIETFLKGDDGIGFLTLLNRLLDILSNETFSNNAIQEFRKVSVYLETRMSDSTLRDAARGLVYTLFHAIAKDSNKSGLLQSISMAVQRDLTLNMILLSREDATKQDIELRATEREVFKKRMRQMNDTERQVTKMLLDIGIASYILTNEDREFFAQEYKYPDPEQEYNDEVADIPASDVPDEGPNAMRDYIDDDVPLGETGQELQVDYGDYGDRYDPAGEEDETGGRMDDGNGYGV
jgi:hypothetical protein